MSSFQSKNLSDEDIAHLLDFCSSDEFRFKGKGHDMQIWQCPVCGAEMSTMLLGDTPISSLRIAHVRAGYVHAWIA